MRTVYVNAILWEIDFLLCSCECVCWGCYSYDIHQTLKEQLWRMNYCGCNVQHTKMSMNSNQQMRWAQQQIRTEHMHRYNSSKLKAFSGQLKILRFLLDFH